MTLLELRPLACDELRARLSEWVDEELPAGDRIRFYLHLSRCVPCRREADAFAAVVRAAHALGARRRAGRRNARA
ncbi:MAG: zf-HC2 domain-containing protein [Anaeromyxobacter sp.]